MKYFTSEWWRAANEEDTTAEKYREFYSSIEAQLPTAIRRLEDEHTLHDARLLKILSDFSNQSLTLILNGWDQGFNEEVLYKLTFTGVVENSLTIPENEDDSAPELSDLGYWEHDTLDTAFQLRALFASGAVLTVTYHGFEFSHEIQA